MAQSAPTVTISANEGVNFVKDMAPEYLKDAQEETLRSRMLLKWLAKEGRIKYNEGDSHTLVWTVEVEEPPTQVYGGYSELTFDEHDLTVQLTGDIRGYAATDKITEKHLAVLRNGGGLAIVNYYDRAIPRLGKALRNRLHAECFIDGYASNNDDRFCGFDSCTGVGTTAVGDRVAEPSDTYGGQSTALNGLGGSSWSDDLGSGNFPNATIATDWPFGQGETKGTRYDALTPLLINTTSTGWPAESNKWDDNLEYAMRQAFSWQETRGGPDNRPKVALWAGDMYTPIQNYFSARFRDIVPHKEADDMGFGEGTLNFDGVMLRTEYDVPAGTGFGLCPEALELCFVYDEMWQPEGPEKDIKTGATLFKIHTFGNMRLRPKGLTKFKAYASA